MRPWVTNGALLAGSLLLALGLMEWAVRTFAPQPTAITHQDRYGLGIHYPGITRYLPQYGHKISFNSAGMRDREHPLQKPPGVFRILLLGDSFMEAAQVPFEESMPCLLEQSLTEGSGRRVEVINAGVGGWGTDDELRYLTEYGLRYRPDLVVVAMTLHNDISDNLRRQWHTLRNDSLVAQPVQPMSFLQYKIVQLKAFIATRSELYQLWRRVRHGREIRQVGRSLNQHVVQLFQVPPPPAIVTGMHLTDRLLRAIRDTARVSGAGLALVLLPIRYQLDDSAFAALMASAGVPLASTAPNLPQREIQAMADSLQVPVVDLLPVFRRWEAARRPSPYLEWDGHWNAVGHRLAADSVARRFLQLGIPGSPAAAPESP